MNLLDRSAARLVVRRRVRAPESYYGRRRDDLTAGFAIAAGLFAALAQGARTWLLIVRGVRHFDPAPGLLRYMLVVVEAAVIGAVTGAVVGWMLGFLWERWHRWRRARRALG
jgi:hypothetical protein